MELKRTANSLREENLKTRTRLRVLERDLQRRERLLRQLALTKKAGTCVDMDIIEKLREERNMLPIVRKKAQELHLQVDAKDEEIRELKRDPQFTRIIELQVDYATWQHEAKRLASLLQEAAPESNNVARREIEVHEQRAEKLQKDLSAAGERRKKVALDLQEMEVDHADWLKQYHGKEKELQGQQELTRELAISFKKVLQERKQLEQLQDEIEEMNLSKRRYEDELNSGGNAPASPQGAASPARGASAALGRASVSQAARSGLPPQQGSRARVLLSAIGRAAASRSGDASLFAEFLRRDTDSDGFLSMGELAQALAAFGLSSFSQQDLTALLDLCPRGDGAQPAQVRWLDLLMFIDRSVAAVRPPALPPVAPLRAACLRSELAVEEFQRRLCATATREQAEAFFAGLGLESSVTAAWLALWDAHGPDGLLLRLPMGDIAIRKADFDSWFARCVDAVRKHKKDLLDSLTVWREDMMLEPDQFDTICLDVLGLQLSQDDIRDLALFISGGGGGHIDGGALLRIQELRK